MQVGHVDAGADEVLGLFDQAGALGSAHGNVVVLAPLLGGGSDHHVSGAAFEHAGLEDVEDVGDTVEHGELAVPLGEGARGLDTGLASDGGNVDKQLGQRLGQAVDAREGVGGLFVGGQDGLCPGGGCTPGQASGGDGLAEEGAGGLALVHGDLKEGLIRQADAGRGCALAAGEVGERTQGIGRAYAEASVGFVQGLRVGTQRGTHVAQAGAHRVDAHLVDDGSHVVHCFLDARGKAAPRVGVSVDVGDDVGQAQVG